MDNNEIMLSLCQPLQGIAVGFADGQLVLVYEYTVAANGGDGADANNIRFVDADEPSRRQHIFQRLHADAHEHGPLRRGEMQAGVVFHGFYHHDLVEHHFYLLVVYLQEDKAAVFGAGSSAGFEVMLLEGFVSGLHEALVGYGLEEIIHHIEVEAFERVLLISGDENDHRFLLQRLDELQAAEAGHLDIGKDEIDGHMLERVYGLECVAAAGYELQVRQLGNIILQEIERERLIVEREAAKGGHTSCSWRSAANQCSSRVMVSL